MSLNPATYVRKRAPKPESVVTLTGATDAIAITTSNIFVINRTGAVNATTLASPDTTDDDRVIWIKNGTTQANTITIAAGLGGSGAGYTTITFTAVAAANVLLRAHDGAWHIIGGHLYTVA